MNNIQINGVKSTLDQVIFEDVQYLKKHLDQILESSNQTLIENLIRETEMQLEQAKDDSITYREKYIIFNQLTEAWLDLWKHYRNYSEALDFGKSIDHLTNYSIAYSKLCLGLSHINEGRTGQHRDDLERIVSGFLLVSETIDVFINYFSDSELKQIDHGAKNAIFISTRSVEKYFEDDLELSHLVTQLRAYSSLIILKIEDYFNDVDSTQSMEQNPEFDEAADYVLAKNAELYQRLA